MPAPTTEELRAWAQYIRNTLGPQIAFHGPSKLAPSQLASLADFLASIESSPSIITTSSLRTSRLHTAFLKDIVALGTRWPAGLVDQCEDLLYAWTKRFGDLGAIKHDIWGPEGRMHGVEMLTGPGGEVSGGLMPKPSNVYRDRWDRSPWVIREGRDPRWCLREGHNRFEVGQWWIKAAAACRDGIIHNSTDGITADANGAYAILMTGDEEIVTYEANITIYRAQHRDRGVFKLMKNLTSQRLVRVLRTWRLKSRFSPKAGIRYDGLYHVRKFSFSGKPNESQEWQNEYMFTLERHTDQEPLAKALMHPVADEMDDWNDYQRWRRRILLDYSHAEEHTGNGTDTSCYLSISDALASSRVSPDRERKNEPPKRDFNGSSEDESNQSEHDDADDEDSDGALAARKKSVQVSELEAGAGEEKS